MAYVVGRGVGGQHAAAVLGSLLSLFAAMGCSDSGDGLNNSGGAGGTGGTTDGGNLPWKAIPMDGALCRDGSGTGYGISINPASKKLLIYMEGGGACFNNLSCLQNPDRWAATDANMSGTASHSWILSRSSDNSPFKDWNLAYIPYCSGDVHTGTSRAGYMGQPQIGYLNYKMDLADILSKLPPLEQVVLSGSSAGGFGVAWNWAPTQDALGSVPVYALDDSGPPMSSSFLTECQQQRVGELWGWMDTVPAMCPACDVKAGRVVGPLVDVAIKKNSSTRLGLLSYDEDGTIKTFFGYGYNNCVNWDAKELPTLPIGKYPEGLAELRQNWAPYKYMAMFVVAGNSHTFLGSDVSSQKTGTVPMTDWISKLVDKSAEWTNVVP